MRTTKNLLQIKSLKMPLLLLLCAAVLVLGSSAERYMPAAEDGINYGRAMVKKACCAEITDSSVIQSVPGNSGNVALILDRGPDPVHLNGRACTDGDKDFV